MYIQAGDTFTVRGIPDGTYNLYYALGKDWVDGNKPFSILVEYSRFADKFKFEVVRTFWGGERYTIWTVTLHPIVGGTAETYEVKEEDFPKP